MLSIRDENIKKTACISKMTTPRLPDDGMIVYESLLVENLISRIPIGLLCVVITI